MYTEGKEMLRGFWGEKGESYEYDYEYEEEEEGLNHGFTRMDTDALGQEKNFNRRKRRERRECQEVAVWRLCFLCCLL